MGDRPFVSLAGEPALARLADLGAAQGSALHLVGGAVRDLLVGRAPEDLDLVVDGDVERLAAAFAAASPATLVRLDEAPLTIRIVRKDVARPGAVIDLAACRDASLEADLRRRDFTVNAIAVPLRSIVDGAAAPLVDPTGGLADLDRRLVRMTSPLAFDEDPLRTLRAHRLAAGLGFRLDRVTARAAALRAPRLAAVSPEQLAGESFRLLAVGDVAPRLGRLGRAGLLEPALGLEGPPEAGWRAALGRFARLCAPASAAPAEALAAAALDRPVAAGRSRAALVRFALVAGARAPDAARRLRLAAREIAFVGTLLAVLRAVHGMSREEAADPAWLVRHVVRAATDDAEAALLFALAATPAAVARRRIAAALGTLAALVRPRLAGPRLVSGDDLVSALGLVPGPAVGRLLEWVDEARAAGLVADRQAALALARRRAAEACRVGEHPV